MKCFKKDKHNILIILTKWFYKNRIMSFYMAVMRQKANTSLSLSYFLFSHSLHPPLLSPCPCPWLSPSPFLLFFYFGFVSSELLLYHPLDFQVHCCSICLKTGNDGYCSLLFKGVLARKTWFKTQISDLNVGISEKGMKVKHIVLILTQQKENVPLITPN